MSYEIFNVHHLISCRLKKIFFMLHEATGSLIVLLAGQKTRSSFPLDKRSDPVIQKCAGRQGWPLGLFTCIVCQGWPEGTVTSKETISCYELPPVQFYSVKYWFPIRPTTFYYIAKAIVVVVLRCPVEKYLLRLFPNQHKKCGSTDIKGRNPEINASLSQLLDSHFGKHNLLHSFQYETPCRLFPIQHKK